MNPIQSAQQSYDELEKRHHDLTEDYAYLFIELKRIHGLLGGLIDENR
jgi:hypothetical protein